MGVEVGVLTLCPCGCGESIGSGSEDIVTPAAIVAQLRKIARGWGWKACERAADLIEQMADQISEDAATADQVEIARLRDLVGDETLGDDLDLVNRWLACSRSEAIKQAARSQKFVDDTMIALRDVADQRDHAKGCQRNLEILITETIETLQEGQRRWT